MSNPIISKPAPFKRDQYDITSELISNAYIILSFSALLDSVNFRIQGKNFTASAYQYSVISINSDNSSLYPGSIIGNTVVSWRPEDCEFGEGLISIIDSSIIGDIIEVNYVEYGVASAEVESFSDYDDTVWEVYDLIDSSSSS